MSKQKILFLAANPLGADPLALDLEARAIQIELERSAHRDQFEFVTRWAVQPLDLLGELRRVKPTVVHFSGHGWQEAGLAGGRDVASTAEFRGEPQPGLCFQGSDGRPAVVSTRAIADTFAAAGSAVKVVVLSACYSTAQAAALVEHVDVAVGTVGSIRDDAAVGFAIGFYGGLGDGEPVEVAFRQGCAAIGLYGLANSERPQIELHDGADASKISLVAERIVPASPRSPRSTVDAGVLRPSDAPMKAQRLLAICKAAGLHANRQAQWTQIGPTEAIGHGSRDPRIFYVNHRQDLADLRRYSGPADLMTRAIESGGGVSNGQIVARIPLGLFSEEEWRRFVGHNA